MKTGGKGGANTRSGLEYEEAVDFQNVLKQIAGYDLLRSKKRVGVDVLFNGSLVARLFRKAEFYRFLTEQGVEWEKIVSKRLLPDDALLVIVRETLFIIEIKFQNVAGSVDEKLQTCDFKRKQYQKLVRSLELKVEYVYLLNKWFRDPRYRDVLDYIDSVGCHYKFESLPLAWLGLPYDATETTIKFS